MVEKIERKIETAGEEAQQEQKIKLEEIKVQETPEQKEEREYQENLERILVEAERYIESQKVDKLKDEILKAAQTAELPEPPTVLNLEKYQEELKQETPKFLERLKNTMEGLVFRTLLIKPEKMRGLISYLEENFSYFQFSIIDHTRTLSKLLQQVNDPVEIIERLKRLEFPLENINIHKEDSLFALLSSPEVLETLKKIDTIGVWFQKKPPLSSGPYYLTYSESEKLLHQFIAQNDFLTEEVVKKTKVIHEKLGVKIPGDIEQIKNLLQVLEDEKTFKLLINFCKSDYVDRDNPDLVKHALNFISGLPKDLIDNTLALSEAKIIDLGNKWFLDVEGNYDELRHYAALYTIMRQEETSDILNNKELLQFFSKLALFLPQRFSPSDVKYQVLPLLEHQQESLAIMSLFKNLGIDLRYISNLAEIHYLVLDNEGKKDMKIIFQPGFQSFIKDVQEQLGCKINLEDLFQGRARAHNSLIDLFINRELREKILSKEGTELIKLIGFDRHAISTYTEILEIPNILLLLKELNQKLGYDLIYTQIGCDLNSLKKLAESGELQAQLFSEKTMDFYHKLKESFDYKFTFNAMEELIAGANDVSFQDLLFKEETKNFIKETFNITNNLWSLQQIKNIDPNFYPLFLRLSRKVGYKLRGQEFAKEQVEFLLQHEEEIIKTYNLFYQLFQRQGLDILQNAPEIYKIATSGILEILEKFQTSTTIQNLIINNIERFTAIPSEKREAYIEIFLKIEDSPSQEIQRIKDSLLEEILNTDDPVASYSKIEKIFIHNNLPTVGKVFKVFQVLHPKREIENKLMGQGRSPILTRLATHKKYETIFNSIIYPDLLKAHIFSANRSLREYIAVLEEGQDIISEAEEKGLDQLNDKQKEQLHYFFDRLATLFVNSVLGKHIEGEVVTPEMTLQEKYQMLKENFAVKKGQTITEKIGEMFLKPLGFIQLEEVEEAMKKGVKEANKRGRKLAQSAKDGYLELKEGDLLKGVQGQYISNILQNGSVAKEFLGYAAASDMTPFDTDLSRVEADDIKEGFTAALQRSLSMGFGNLLFVLRDHNKFQRTSPEFKGKCDRTKYELFQVSGKHYGIRTGFPSTEIDFMIAQEALMQNSRELEKIYYEIAQNSFYIPITDSAGKIIFTEEMYQEYRKTFDGLERFYGDDLKIMPTKEANKHYEQIMAIIPQMEQEMGNVQKHTQIIRKITKEVLKENGVYFKESELDPSIIGAELLDIGSTGRNTNIPGESYDFDFTLKLDAKDFSKAAEIAQKIKNRFQIGEDKSHQEAGGYYQLVVKNVVGITTEQFSQPLNFDIGFVKKSDSMIFGSHDAIIEKLNWTKENQGEEIYKQVIANIILTKRVLSKGQAYKRVEHGGFGGIGVENWILANNGNMIEAFKTFYQAANDGKGRPVLFEEFKKKYKILNAGMNLKHLYHDNYIENLSQTGYEKMFETIKAQIDKEGR